MSYTEPGTPSFDLLLIGEEGCGVSFYQYNSRNQLTTLSGDGFIASYRYNGDGLRCAKTVVEGNQTTQTNYFYENDKVVFEKTVAGGETSTDYNQYGNGQLIFTRTGDGAYYYYIYNGHGDVEACPCGCLKCWRSL